MLLVTVMVLMLLFTLLGMEIAWAIGVACMAYVVLTHFTSPLPTPPALFSQQLVEGVSGFALLAVPLFIFAGELMNRAGVTQRLIAMASALVGHRQGGLANVGVTANFVMSGISGSAMADAAATGAVLVPEMKRRGYPAAFASAVIAASSTVGPIIPPSISFVLLGAIMNISVGRLFLGGVVPGIIMFVAMFALTARLTRDLGVPREPRVSGAEFRAAMRGGFLPMLAPVFVIGSIVGGIATPTEAAAIAVAYTFVLGALVYRSLDWRSIQQCAVSTAMISAVVSLTVATSQMFAWITVQEQLGAFLAASLSSMADSRVMLLLLTNVLLLVLGMFMEPLPIMLVMAPIMFPMLGRLGVDDVHLGVVFVLNLMIGMITPPIGLNLFVLSAIARVEVMAVGRACLPYIAVLVAVLALITYVPELTLWLPRLAMG
ncbi:MAG: TRAP transporter large permease [Alphaproteobacteria bacterium]